MNNPIKELLALMKSLDDKESTYVELINELLKVLPQHRGVPLLVVPMFGFPDHQLGLRWTETGYLLLIDKGRYSFRRDEALEWTEVNDVPAWCIYYSMAALLPKLQEAFDHIIHTQQKEVTRLEELRATLKAPTDA